MKPIPIDGQATGQSQHFDPSRGQDHRRGHVFTTALATRILASFSQTQALRAAALGQVDWHSYGSGCRGRRGGELDTRNPFVVVFLIYVMQLTM